MKIKLAFYALALTFATIGGAQAETAAPTPTVNTVPVTADNFTRAESDLYFHSIGVKEGGFGKFFTTAAGQSQDVADETRRAR